jgi:hypothetical protein
MEDNSGAGLFGHSGILHAMDISASVGAMNAAGGNGAGGDTDWMAIMSDVLPKEAFPACDREASTVASFSL